VALLQRLRVVLPQLLQHGAPGDGRVAHVRAELDDDFGARIHGEEDLAAFGELVRLEDHHAGLGGDVVVDGVEELVGQVLEGVFGEGHDVGVEGVLAAIVVLLVGWWVRGELKGDRDCQCHLRTCPLGVGLLCWMTWLRTIFGVIAKRSNQEPKILVDYRLKGRKVEMRDLPVVPFF
jgi:hypothetical protein